jgi:hypothetical protein
MLRFSRSLMPAVSAIMLTAAVTLPAAAAASTPVAPVAELPSTGIGWSGALPVPGSETSLAPALTAINFPARKADPVILWAAPSAGGDRISYAAAVNLSAGRWTRPALVDAGLARTDQDPAAAPFGGNPASRIIVVWQQSQGRQLRYSVGTAAPGGVVKWADNGKALTVPSAVTTSGPAVYSPQHSRFVVVAWTAATTSAVLVIAGIPLKSGVVRWGQVTRIAGARASGSPAIAEANVPGAGGRLFVLWRSAGNLGRIVTSFTADPLRLKPGWSQPMTLSSKVTTAAAPAAQAIGTGGTFPFLLVYLAVRGTTLHYVTLSARGTTSSPLRVPGLTTDEAPALSSGILAATAPPAPAGARTPSGQEIYYIRICPGCWLNDG